MGSGAPAAGEPSDPGAGLGAEAAASAGDTVPVRGSRPFFPRQAGSRGAGPGEQARLPP